MSKTLLIVRTFQPYYVAGVLLYLEPGTKLIFALLPLSGHGFR